MWLEVYVRDEKFFELLEYFFAFLDEQSVLL